MFGALTLSAMVLTSGMTLKGSPAEQLTTKQENDRQSEIVVIGVTALCAVTIGISAGLVITHVPEVNTKFQWTINQIQSHI